MQLAKDMEKLGRVPIGRILPVFKARWRGTYLRYGVAILVINPQIVQ